MHEYTYPYGRLVLFKNGIMQVEFLDQNLLIPTLRIYMLCQIAF